MSEWGKSSIYQPVVPRLIWRSYGPEKTGKDHFGLSAPGPYAKHLFDPGGLEGVADKFQKEIHVFSYKRVDKRVFKKAASGEAARRAWDEAKRQRDDFQENFALSLQHARTISLDETETWELFRFAEFGIGDSAGTAAPKNYDVLNADYRDMIQSGVDARVNLQLIQKLKEKWGSTDEIKVDENGMRRTIKKPYATGEMVPTGYKECGYIVQANLRHYWDKDQGFGIEVLNCRQNMSIAGQTFTSGWPLNQEDSVPLDFSFIAQMIFPDTEAEDWA
jgi:hypothetical protein